MENVGLKWYAARVKNRHEKAVSSGLAMRGFDALLPLYRARNKWSDRVREVELPLFPGYVFCRFDARHSVPILNTPGVYDIVRMGRELAPVDPEEMESLRRLMLSGLPAEPWPRLEVGDYVEIDRGPLEHCHGYVVELRNEFRLLLSVSLLQRYVSVELEREWVTKTAAPKLRLKSAGSEMEARRTA